MCVVTIDQSAIIVDGHRVDVHTRGVISSVAEALGSATHTTEAGVRGVGRTAHWFAAGIVAVTQDADNALKTVYICFSDTDSSPYPQHTSEVAAFHGVVNAVGHSFRGAESLSIVSQIPGVRGIGGMLSVASGALFVGFTLRKSRDRFNRRTGVPRLVQLSFEWGPVQPFRYPEVG